MKNFDIFDNDKAELLKEIAINIELLESYLWNLDKTTGVILKYYNGISKDFEDLQTRTQVFVKNYASQEKLRDEVNDIKSINL